MMPPLALSSVPSGTEILLDANVIAYALLGRSRQCEEFLERCAKGEISAFTAVEVLSDTCHRLMLSEALSQGLIGRDSASNIQGKSHVIRQLNDYWTRLSTVTQHAIAVLPLDEFRFIRAQPIRRDLGLMTTDSLLIAAAEVFGISALATNDSDFDVVHG